MQPRENMAVIQPEGGREGRSIGNVSKNINSLFEGDVLYHAPSLLPPIPPTLPPSLWPYLAGLRPTPGPSCRPAPANGRIF